MTSTDNLSLDELEPNAAPIMSDSDMPEKELDAIYDIPVQISAVLGKSTMQVSQLLKLGRGDSLNLSIISGFKHFNLAEGVSVAGNRTIGSAGQTFLGNPLPIGSTTAWEDDFNTTNRFYGWEFGANWQFRYGRWVAEADFHNAIGVMHETVEYNGFSQATTGPAAARVTQRVPGGLLAAISNLGRTSADTFADIPELRGEIGYRLTRNIRFSMGYTFLYASNVVRAANQINTTVNPTIVPLRPEFGAVVPVPVQPLPVFRRNDYWAQGVNWSLNLTY